MERIPQAARYSGDRSATNLRATWRASLWGRLIAAGVRVRFSAGWIHLDAVPEAGIPLDPVGSHPDLRGDAQHFLVVAGAPEHAGLLGVRDESDDEVLPAGHPRADGNGVPSHGVFNCEDRSRVTGPAGRDRRGVLDSTGRPAGRIPNGPTEHKRVATSANACGGGTG